MFHQETQRLLDLAGAVARAASARNRALTQQRLQELIDSCAVCHIAYRDTGHWRELSKRYRFLTQTLPQGQGRATRRRPTFSARNAVR
jgi:hypothetical protein